MLRKNTSALKIGALYYCETLVTLTIKHSLLRPITRDGGSQISGISAHEGGKVVSPSHRPALPLKKYFWCSFLLEAASNPGPLCGRKDYVNEKFQWHHRESKPRTSASSVVPQSTALPRAPTLNIRLHNPGHDTNLHRCYTLFCVNLQYKVRQ